MEFICKSKVQKIKIKGGVAAFNKIAAESMNQKKIIASVLSLTLTFGSFALPVAESGVIINQISASADNELPFVPIGDTTADETPVTQTVSSIDELNSKISSMNNVVIKLTDDITIGNTAVTVPSGKTFTLDLNGHSITNTTLQNQGIPAIHNYGNLIIKNSDSSNRGKIENKRTDSDEVYYTIMNAGEMVISGVDITSDSEKSSVIHNAENNGKTANLIINEGTTVSSNGAPVIKNEEYNGSEIIINGGTFTNPKGPNATCILNYAKATINNGTFTGCVWSVTQPGLQAGQHGGDMTINDGKFNGNIAVVPDTANSGFENDSTGNTKKYAAMEITGGDFSKLVEFKALNRATVKITGGTFNSNAKYWFSSGEEEYNPTSEETTTKVTVIPDIYNIISKAETFEVPIGKLFRRNDNSNYTLVDAHTITIPEGVSVKNGETKLQSGGKVAKGDKLTVAVDDKDNICYVKAGNEEFTGSVPSRSIVVGDEDITITTFKHEEKTVTGLEATCTHPGHSDATICSKCNKILVASVDIPALGHDYSKEWTIDTEPTCGTEGSKSHHCTRCDEKSDETAIPATGEHKYNETTITKKPTCSEEGEMTQKCSGCGKVKVVKLAKTAHSIVEDPAVAVTCTTDGKTAGSHCEVCGEVIKAQDVIKATGHKYGDAEITKAATCTTDGEKVQKCTVCGDTIKETIKAPGHKESAWIIDKQPTKTEEGSKHTECTVCGEKIKTATIEKIKDDVNPTPVVKTSIKSANAAVSKRVVVYTGSGIKPSVTVKLGKKTLVKDKDYTVSYQNNKEVGKAKVIITGKGDYKDSIVKVFKITAPRQTITKLNAKKNGFGVAFKSVKLTDRYYIVDYCSNKEFKGRGRAVVKTNTYSNVKLKKNHKYYVRVCTVVKMDGKAYYGDWSAVKSVVTK